MTKKDVLALLNDCEEDDEVSGLQLMERINQFLIDEAEQRERTIERLEERQHDSGMYAQQDLIDSYRRER